MRSRKNYSHLAEGWFLARKAAWALSGCMATDSADYYMLVNEWVWSVMRLLINPLITKYAIWHLALAACYQLAQSVFEDRCCASKKGGRGGERVSAWGCLDWL